MSTETDIEKLVDTLSELTVLDMSKLKTALEEKWGVKAQAAAPMMMAAPAAGGGEEAKEVNRLQSGSQRSPSRQEDRRH